MQLKPIFKHFSPRLFKIRCSRCPQNLLDDHEFNENRYNKKILYLIAEIYFCAQYPHLSYGRQEKCIKGFGAETREKETTWKI